MNFAFGSDEILILDIYSCGFQVVSLHEVHVCVSTAFEVTSTSGRIFWPPGIIGMQSHI